MQGKQGEGAGALRRRPVVRVTLSFVGLIPSPSAAAPAPVAATAAPPPMATATAPAPMAAVAAPSPMLDRGDVVSRSRKVADNRAVDRYG
jgi:hypothetical protein